ncbi:MAG: type II toxin-antitoxin system Phd/YefM family antitoxin [Actinomycetota bacterium]|nr:type II toxin-antitoxin system Phd/YefM family antitoxin [Actinomycetota bacterium]
MLVNIKDLISLTEANQNFSKVARTVDEKGSVIILKNNAPHYIVIDFKKLEQMGISLNESMESVALPNIRRIIWKHLRNWLNDKT